MQRKWYLGRYRIVLHTDMLGIAITTENYAVSAFDS